MARKNKKQRKHPKFWFGFKIVLLLFLLTILVGGIVFYFKYGKDIFAMQDDAVALVKESSIDTFRSSETSIVYNNKGKEIAKLKGVWLLISNVRAVNNRQRPTTITEFEIE